MFLNWEMFSNILRLLFSINKELSGRSGGQAEVEESVSEGNLGTCLKVALGDTCPAGLS